MGQWILLAEVPDVMPSWLGTGLGAGGVLIGLSFTVWYAWHTTRHVIPGMFEAFRQERDQDRLSRHNLTTAFNDSISSLNNFNAGEREKERQQDAASAEKLMAHCTEENDKTYARFLEVSGLRGKT